MSPFLGEFVGTACITLLGGGVVANVILSKTKGHNGGLIAITFGWAMAVFIGVFAATKLGSDGHLNPAITIAFALFNEFNPDQVGIYLAAQFLGAMTGSVLAWLAYKQHFDATTDADAKLGVFCTSPAIRNPLFNVITEVIGTFVLVFGALAIAKPSASMGALDALPVALIVLGIGLSLGGPTGYAINPARDLAPRLVHFLLPIPGKRDSDWSYAWVPIVGPLIGAVIAAKVFTLL
jgi:glycerol uptake facilitator protein